VPKLAVLCRPLDRGVSGSGMHLERLMRAFLKVNTKFEVFFVHHEKKHYDIYDQGNDVVASRNPFKLARILNRIGIDIVHFNPVSIFSPIWNLNSRRCATIHGDAEYFLPEEFSLFKRLHAATVIPAYARSMDLIFTVSNATTEFLVAEYGVHRERIIETPNATDSRFRVLA
jgi:hypothetical protein